MLQVRTQDVRTSCQNDESSKLTPLIVESVESDDSNIHKILAELFADLECKKQSFNREEEAFRHGAEQLNGLKEEHAELLRKLELYKRRQKERLGMQKMLVDLKQENGDCERVQDIESDSESDSDHKNRDCRSSSSYRGRRRRSGFEKERKRLKRFQSDLSLRFKLLQSECRRSDLEVEKQMADLRREYADACLFGNSLSF
ncbi:hypothetical protein CCR75_000978 [Bremia lactucae]|uniref:Uncharacterized protein n=1 Tax=Bremia lactucae TaxID=4779 RepID=A0A976FEE7_BRELC|nr:hypothetical protein CCR75_000978 [Bremia lactucae]